MNYKKITEIIILENNFKCASIRRLPIADCQLPIVRSILPIASCQLLIAYCLLLILFSCKESTEHQHLTATQDEVYTCPMHPQIIRDKPGNCPICGMKLVKKESSNAKLNDIQLHSLLKPTNEFVVSTVPVTTMHKKNVSAELQSLGSISYDTRYTNTISSRVSGRIEKLFVKFRYEHIHKGDAVMNIYSPELNTAQQNLIFLLKNDPNNAILISATKEKLSLLGMSGYQLDELMRTQKIAYTITVYSPYTGHVHGAGNMNNVDNTSRMRIDVSQPSEQLPLKEGMYIQKGQPVISVFSTEHAWALLNIYTYDQNLVKAGDAVTITPETAPGKAFKSTISFIEPFYRNGSKTLTARVYFNNTDLNLPIGSQIKALISTSIKNTEWLPEDAVLSLGIDKIVFLKEDGGFRAHKIITGTANENLVQVVSGLSKTDQVAANAQFLADSESFIKINQ
jgi:membrane fusion protein, copper/silver efflux system